jgi:hypothetical protein
MCTSLWPSVFELEGTGTYAQVGILGTKKLLTLILYLFALAKLLCNEASGMLIDEMIMYGSLGS